MDLTEPTVRWGIGLSGGLVVAVIAILFLEGTMQLAALGIAVLDMVVTPLILKQAAESDADSVGETGGTR
ncbi:hypothetical protein [Halopiger xanaduensis]|uniref:Uncharacterized protein n=1 Tax=Halopiger xanaduensis (strain DSM 18323 / JCM 14033 / SH-6) TaxID=797210 RepID=F8D9L1_HALXS|nr:hypothetical protein [Halopiger xanaduensis]AEH38099.1 hypothetical protein Halxa_3488 [Halopiger xanaduensis SH-6]